MVVFPFGQATKISLPFIPFPEVHLYFLDILVFLLVGFWLFWHLISKKRFVLPNFWRSWLLFISLLFLSWLVNFKNFLIRESFVGLLYWLRFVFYSSLSVVVFDLRHHGLEIKNFGRIFTFWGLVLAFSGLLQYFLMPDMRFLSPLGWDLHYYRVAGLFLDPNFMGILLVLGLLGVVGEIGGFGGDGGIEGYGKGWQKTVFLVIIGAPLLLTYSRSAYLALTAGIGVWFYLKRKIHYFIFFLFAFLFLILLLPRPGGEGVKLERTASINQRLVSWKEALTLWRKFPLLGIGFNNYRYVSRDVGYLSGNDWQVNHAGAGVENSYLFLLATGGLLGLLGFFNWLKSIIKETLKLKNEKAGELILISLAAIFVHAFFINSFFYPWVMIWFSFLIANVN